MPQVNQKKRRVFYSSVNDSNISTRFYLFECYVTGAGCSRGLCKRYTHTHTMMVDSSKNEIKKTETADDDNNNKYSSECN